MNENYDEKYSQIENNMFIRLIYKIYNAYKNPKYEDFSPILHRRISANIELYKLLLDADELIKEIREGNIDFWLIYDFGSFIKLMEKIFFVKNDANSKICCDSILEDKNSRVLIFNLWNYEGVTCKVTASLQDQGLNFEITRDFGKQMKNQYKITDQNKNFRLFSDSMTMQRMIEIISNEMADYLKEIIVCKVLDSDLFTSPIHKSFYYYDEFDFYQCTKIKKEYKDIQYLIKHKYIQI